MFIVCLEPTSPTVFRVAFVDAMYTVLKEVSKEEREERWQWLFGGVVVTCSSLPYHI